MMSTAVILGQSVDYPRGYKVAVVTLNSETNARPALANVPPGPLVLKAVTLKELIAHAYAAPSFQVIGGPEWVDTDRWDFRLETEPPLMPTERYGQVVLRALEDRFGLENTSRKQSHAGLRSSGGRRSSSPGAFVTSRPACFG